MLDNFEQKELDFRDIYFGEMGMCNCGNPEDVKKFLYELLKNHKGHISGEITYDEMVKTRERIIKETDTDVIFEFVFHVFERIGLLQHGGSVYGSWLTEKGERFFDLLSENLSDDDGF